MNRNLYLVLGAGALIAMAACTVKSETSGTGGNTTTHSTTTHTGTGGSGNTGAGGTGATGGGGGAACLTCNEWLQCAGQGCEANTCAGAATDAYDALAACACDACQAECPSDICPNGTGTGGSAAADCATCQATALGSTCSAELGDCTNN